MVTADGGCLESALLFPSRPWILLSIRLSYAWHILEVRSSVSSWGQILSLTSGRRITP